ncbi:hypothetical protein CLOSTASPAR_03121 [[Clostridium] asparagiforme DSM 15981]|uniref:Uncharacterized protein n=1 Tax=[Clostridium] asparagiforme DSM 15981 TaxID=518636 RepID=C0D1I3_9FIRM|nr:hypothetical protein CLOSTASPAR_03121 [[Clostridium] asparagiforme DSM 15981]
MLKKFRIFHKSEIKKNRGPVGEIRRFPYFWKWHRESVQNMTGNTDESGTIAQENST